jgi:hypothetical protein
MAAKVQVLLLVATFWLTLFFSGVIYGWTDMQLIMEKEDIYGKEDPKCVIIIGPPAVEEGQCTGRLCAPLALSSPLPTPCDVVDRPAWSLPPPC